jgi:hypothetical protein
LQTGMATAMFSPCTQWLAVIQDDHIAVYSINQSLAASNRKPFTRFSIRDTEPRAPVFERATSFSSQAEASLIRAICWVPDGMDGSPILSALTADAQLVLLEWGPIFPPRQIVPDEIIRRCQQSIIPSSMAWSDAQELAPSSSAELPGTHGGASDTQVVYRGAFIALGGLGTLCVLQLRHKWDWNAKTSQREIEFLCETDIRPGDTVFASGADTAQMSPAAAALSHAAGCEIKASARYLPSS